MPYVVAETLIHRLKNFDVLKLKVNMFNLRRYIWLQNKTLTAHDKTSNQWFSGHGMFWGLQDQPCTL